MSLFSHNYQCLTISFLRLTVTWSIKSLLLLSDTLFFEHDLLNLYHVFVLKCPHDKVLVEYGAITATDREKYLMFDIQSYLIFWQGAATHHLRKFNVKETSPPYHLAPHRPRSFFLCLSVCLSVCLSLSRTNTNTDVL